MRLKQKRQIVRKFMAGRGVAWLAWKLDMEQLEVNDVIRSFMNGEFALAPTKRIHSMRGTTRKYVPNPPQQKTKGKAKA